MSKCILCEESVSHELYEGILKCESCEYVFADLNLTQNQFAKLYGEDYFHGEEYSDYTAEAEAIQRNFRNRFQVLQKFLDPKKHQSILEIGSAYGFFLDVVRKKFKSHVGLDVCESAVTYARDNLSLNAHCVDFLNWDMANSNIDVACMWDTIEHLKSPELYLQKLSQNMKSDALIAITTGDIDSLLARVRKKRWRLIHPPTHAHYFSKKTITKMLQKYGFEVVHFEYCGFWRNLDNIFYNIFVLRWKKAWIYSLLKKAGLARGAFYANFFDIMYIIAKKSA